MASDDADTTDAPKRPVLKVISGNPTPEELAAVIALVSARSGVVVEDEPEPVSLWARPQLRAPLHAGAGAWWASGLPQRWS